MSQFRHEFKYLAPESVLAVQQARLSSVLPLDGNAGRCGRYSIRSVYFDDLYDTCYFENEDGADPREKFRIRIYDCARSPVTLELKQKQNGMCRKRSCAIPAGLCEDILAGKIPALEDGSPYLLKKLVMQMRFRALRPVVVVAYERTPFVFPAGNVRITIDRNIRSGCDIGGFFRADTAFRPVLPVGTNMIEVKFDSLLPDFIDGILQTGMLSQTSFSKYYLCRKFSLNSLRGVS